MMNNTFLTIKEPCQQGWGNMSISEKGKFCSSCQKHVHDFSNSTLDEIKKVYAESKDGLCGHVPVKLLQEQYVEKELQKVHFSYLKKFCLAAILCFGASLFTVDAAKASTFYKVKTAFLNFSTNKDTIVVKGIIKDRVTHQRIAFATVSVWSNGSVIAYSNTNSSGEYELKIPKEYSIVDIQASYIGYDNRRVKNISVSINKNIVVDIDMQLQEEIMLEGDIDINHH